MLGQCSAAPSCPRFSPSSRSPRRPPAPSPWRSAPPRISRPVLADAKAQLELAAAAGLSIVRLRRRPHRLHAAPRGGLRRPQGRRSRHPGDRRLALPRRHRQSRRLAQPLAGEVHPRDGRGLQGPRTHSSDHGRVRLPSLRPVLEVTALGPEPELDAHLDRRLEKLFSFLGQAFDGTAQAGSALPIVYDEYVVQSVPPPEKQSLYSGQDSPAAADAVDEGTQALYYRQALQLAFCQPTVSTFLIFHIVDEIDLRRWQSGLFYPDLTPKTSFELVRSSVLQARRGTLVRCSGEIEPIQLLGLASPAERRLPAGNKAWPITAGCVAAQPVFASRSSSAPRGRRGTGQERPPSRRRAPHDPAAGAEGRAGLLPADDPPARGLDAGRAGLRREQAAQGGVASAATVSERISPALPESRSVARPSIEVGPWFTTATLPPCSSVTSGSSATG